MTASATHRVAACNLVDLVDEDHPGLLDALNSGPAHRLHVHELRLLLGNEMLERLRYSQPPRFRPSLEHVAHHVLQVDADLLDGRPGNHLEGRHRRVAHVELDDAIVEAAFLQLLAHALARAARLLAGHRVVARDRRARGRQQQVEQALLCGAARLVAHFLGLLGAHHVDGQLHEVAHHRLDIAADVADLGELRRLDLDERRLRQPGEPPRDLRLADAGRPDHQDVLRRDFLGHVRREALPANAVADGNRDRALGLRLTDHVFIELGDDLPRRQRVDRACGTFGKKDGHESRITILQSSGACWCKCRCRRQSPSPLRRSDARSTGCGGSAPVPPPWRKDHPSPPPRYRRRAR